MLKARPPQHSPNVLFQLHALQGWVSQASSSCRPLPGYKSTRPSSRLLGALHPHPPDACTAGTSDAAELVRTACQNALSEPSLAQASPVVHGALAPRPQLQVGAGLEEVVHPALGTPDGRHRLVPLGQLSSDGRRQGAPRAVRVASAHVGVGQHLHRVPVKQGIHSCCGAPLLGVGRGAASAGLLRRGGEAWWGPRVWPGQVPSLDQHVLGTQGVDVPGSLQEQPGNMNKMPALWWLQSPAV